MDAQIVRSNCVCRERHVSLSSKSIYNVSHRMDAQNGQACCPTSHDRKTLSRFSSSSAVRSGWFTNITFRANPFPTEVTVQGPPKFFHARKSAFSRTQADQRSLFPLTASPSCGLPKVTDVHWWFSKGDGASVSRKAAAIGFSAWTLCMSILKRHYVSTFWTSIMRGKSARTRDTSTLIGYYAQTASSDKKIVSSVRILRSDNQNGHPDRRKVRTLWKSKEPG